MVLLIVDFGGDFFKALFKIDFFFQIYIKIHYNVSSFFCGLMSHFASLVFISYIHKVNLVASDVEIQVKSK